VSGLTPHGPGFSFLDAFKVVVPGERGRGRKWLDPTFPFFADHFPGEPLMPGVLLIEAGAQTAGALWATVLGADLSARFVLAQVVQFKIARPVAPGATLDIDATLEKSLGTLAQFEVVVSADGSEAARGRIVLGRP
jgi:3-hydroxyacyl-[acyl-carrier-protein] dehydratase